MVTIVTRDRAMMGPQWQPHRASIKTVLRNAIFFQPLMGRVPGRFSTFWRVRVAEATLFTIKCLPSDSGAAETTVTLKTRKMVSGATY